MIRAPDQRHVATALQWTSYSVSRADKAPLLDFIVAGLLDRECRIVWKSEPDRAPFYIVFDTPGGERQGVLAYAFYANSQLTTNRPEDEHRFQIKYGGNLRDVLNVAVDPHELVTTVFLGIDTQRGIFIAADPLMNNPSPMSRSIEFKSHNAEAAHASGWHAWERDRRPGKSRFRPTAELEDLRTEVLIGGTRDRLLDLVALERIARGLDPGERHLIADKLATRATSVSNPAHKLLQELNLETEPLLDLIASAARLKMAVRGWVAEKHLADSLTKLAGVTECIRLEEEGKPDISLRWKGGAPLLVECKNTLRSTYADGRPKLDFQRTRASKGDPCSRYYKAEDFPVLAACLHAVTEKWEFRFARTSDLEPHRSCPGRLTNSVAVADPVFTSTPEYVFDKCSGLG